mmetsp:Transcript_147919/g.368592  ORF Transcript_147919/g.368592 Transcript_147919/m.368592 type:complete len:218 (-) Transcript_147919:39-692(-)
MLLVVLDPFLPLLCQPFKTIIELLGKGSTRITHRTTHLVYRFDNFREFRFHDLLIVENITEHIQHRIKELHTNTECAMRNVQIWPIIHNTSPFAFQVFNCLVLKPLKCRLSFRELLELGTKHGVSLHPIVDPTGDADRRLSTANALEQTSWPLVRLPLCSLQGGVLYHRRVSRLRLSTSIIYHWPNNICHGALGSLPPSGKHTRTALNLGRNVWTQD